MHIADALQEATLPALEREVLLASLLKKNRAWILAHGEHALSTAEEHTFHEWVSRRKNHEPIAYIIGRKEFFGREFRVTPDVLIPRPETEELVRITLSQLPGGESGITDVNADIVVFTHRFREKTPEVFVDIGTGSGCIAITLALETRYPVIATDVSNAALSVAQNNAGLLRVPDRITFRKGNLLKPVRDLRSPFFLVSNPPYVPDAEIPMPDVMEYEPHLSLFAGPEGMGVLQPLIEQAMEHPYCTGFALECRRFQAEKLQKIL